MQFNAWSCSNALSRPIEICPRSSYQLVVCPRKDTRCRQCCRRHRNRLLRSKGASDFLRTIASILIVFLWQSYPDAIKHYNSKVDYLNGNLAKLEETIGKKRENMDMLVQLMQKKLQEETQIAKS